MVEKIIETIWDDKLRVYKAMRKDWEERINELDKERSKIMRKKKNKKEKSRQLLKNTIEKVYIICIVLKQTFLHYQKQYFESDNYRQIKLLEIQLSETSKLFKSGESLAKLKSEEDKAQSYEEKMAEGTKKAFDLVAAAAPKEEQEQEQPKPEAKEDEPAKD